MAEQPDYRYDVFISYSHKDETWVTQTLLPRLEKAGLRVCIDYRDFRPGAPSVKEMKRAVSESRKTLLILTPDYLASGWTEFEVTLAQTLDPANRDLRLIPLLKAKCDLPLEISYLTYVDFARPDRAAVAWTMLLTALGAPPPPEPPEEPRREAWCLAHPYPMPPNFTGRAAEREMLSEWLDGDADHPLLLLYALGGFGKSALCWHWLLHDVDPARWPHVMWWSFYEGDASFDSFLRETLTYLGADPHSLGPRQQADALLRLLRRPGTLLILDGFERALRAYAGMDAAYRGDLPAEPEPTDHAARTTQPNERDCINMIAEHFLRGVASLPGLHSKVLLTSRLRPRALEVPGGILLAGCREEELTQMQPADAVAFFRAQGIRGGRAEIEAACAPYGYHPLSLRLLAGLVAADPQQPGDIAAARRLDVAGDLVQRRHHVLEQAYESLTAGRRRLLSQIACFRGPVGYEALAALAASPPEPLPQPPLLKGEGAASPFPSREGGQGVRSEPPSEAVEGERLDADLRDLVARGLLHHDLKTNRYDLHPIVRRYAYDRLAGDERSAAHTRLRDYFAAVPPPDKVQTLDDLAPVIELYHHTVRAGEYDEARTLFRDRVNQATYYQFGAYQLRIELLRALFPDGEDHPPHLKKESDQAWTLVALANSYSLNGQPRRAVPLFERQIAIREKQGDNKNLAVGLSNLANRHRDLGALRAAEVNLHRCIDLGREIANEFWEAVGHRELGRLLAYRGVWGEAEEELATALALFEKERAIQSQGIVWAYRALRGLLLARTSPSPPASLPEGEGGEGEALAAARRTLELADEDTRTRYPHPRDYVRAHWLLGAAHLANGDPEAAERHLTEALTRCRGINMVDHEANILLDMARLALLPPGPRSAAGAGSPSGRGGGGEGEAARLAEEALSIAERCGYVLQEADAHLLLAQMALAAGDRDGAREHAQAARRLATCDGPPDYTYKVAYDEAGVLLEELG
jgi:tetratricopeptide (TPR) repeat protein